MKRKSLYEIAELTRSIDEYHESFFYGIRRKRYLYIVVFSFLLILACLSYGGVVDISKYWNINGQEHLLALFCFSNIAASIWVLNLKKEWYAIKDFLKCDETEAQAEIKKLRQVKKNVLESGARELAASFSMIITIVVTTILTSYKEGVSFIDRFKNLANDNDIYLFSMAIYLIAFIVGDVIGSPYLPVRYKKRQKKVEVISRNIIMDSLTISKLNPDLNE